MYRIAGYTYLDTVGAKDASQLHGKHCRVRNDLESVTTQGYVDSDAVQLWTFITWSRSPASSYAAHGVTGSCGCELATVVWLRLFNVLRPLDLHTLLLCLAAGLHSCLDRTDHSYAS